jgi:UDP-N-acetylmuramate--alanine ligase
MPTEGPVSGDASANSSAILSAMASGAPSTAHLVGICGTGMRALAELLDGLGWRLSGSDLQPPSAAITSLVERGLRFHHGHDAAHVPSDATCLVFSPAIGPENPERLAAARRGVPQFSYSQMIGRLMASRVGVCVAGTHGKSTTTAMVGWILTHAGRDPSVIVGAELCCDLTRTEESLILSPQSRGAGARMETRNESVVAIPHSGRAGTGGLFVVESCEFNRSFLDFAPRFAAILGIEPDHFDCYADLASLVQAFGEFARLVPADGILLANGECEATHKAVRQSPARVVTFGGDARCDWQSDTVRHTPKGSQFRVRRAGRAWGEIELRLHGDHNVQNALAAAALCAEMGLTCDEVADGLRTFGGVRRRFEILGDWHGVTRIDDYAHHPTAVRATLRTARQVYGTRRIWCLFQPHQVSRTLALLDDFSASFTDADEVVIAPVFAARERLTGEPVSASQELVRRIAARGKSARFVESLDRIASTVEDATRPGDVVIAMGAGDIDRIHHDLTRPVC